MSPLYRDIGCVLNGQYGITNYKLAVVLPSNTVLFVEETPVVNVRL